VNNKKAYTLIEMMVSIGIIVILSSVFTASLTIYMDKAHSASNGVDSHLNKYDAAKSSVNDLRGVAGVPAVVVPGTYTVNFDPLGGSSVDSINAVPENTTISAPSTPTWTGHSFVAWYKELACSTLWNFSSDKVTGNITLYAKWIASAPAANYMVTFDPLGGSSVGSINAVPENTTISAPSTPTWTGYSFVAWYKELACSTLWNFSSDKVTGNITLYAKWIASAPAIYIVTLDSLDGSAVGPVTAEANTTISTLPSPAKTANTFDGWYKDLGCLTAWNYSTDTVTGNVTLYAKWTPSTTALTVTMTYGGDWGNGPYIRQYYLVIKNTGATKINSWAVTITFPTGSTIAAGWNATYSISGTTLTITADSNSKNIQAGGSIDNITFQINTPSSFTAMPPVATGS